MQTHPRATQSEHVACPNHSIPCQVSITTADGIQHVYYALMPSTCAAVIHALEHFGICKVRVQSLRRNQP